MACRSGCKTQDHANWGACARAADLQIDRHGLKGFRHLEKDKDKRLASYESARNSGLQPKTTQWQDIRAASETGGVAHTPITETSN